MQNRYVGDVGDFGKYGMLRAILRDTGLRLGVNWYLVADESHTNDGKFTDYLNSPNSISKSLEICDIGLFRELRRIIVGNNRCVEAVQNAPILPSNTSYYSILIPNSTQPSNDMIVKRKEWFNASLIDLSGCNILFLDPDNGLEVKSAPIGTIKSVKYVLYDEVRRYYAAGYSIIIYNHRDRSEESDYYQRFHRIKEFIGKEIRLPVLRFNRYSVRDYVFVLQDDVEQAIEEKICEFMKTTWAQHWMMKVLL